MASCVWLSGPSAGADVLTVKDGGSALAIYDGLAGADTFNFRYTINPANFTLTKSADGAVTISGASNGHSINVKLVNFETIVYSGTSLAVSSIPVGTAAADTLTGTAYKDVISGFGGNDTISGGAANDTLVGGTGNDTYIMDSASDMITELAGEGTDTVIASISYSLLDTDGTGTNGGNVENLTLTGSSAINATGNALNNKLTGNSAANTLIGHAGNDRLNGGSGSDTMTGGAGNDSYYVNTASDVITELTGEGTDTVNASISYSIADTDGAGTNGGNVENLTLTGTAAINATGNAFNNVLKGNAAVNTLKGGAGNDKLYGDAGNDKLHGGLGNDLLTGGTGSDLFVFDTAPNSASNIDTITDFVHLTDKIQLDDDIFTAMGVVGTSTGVGISSAAFYAGTAAHDASDRIIYDKSTGALYYDADGDGAGAAVQFATVGSTTHPTVTSNDFTVIA